MPMTVHCQSDPPSPRSGARSWVGVPGCGAFETYGGRLRGGVVLPMCRVPLGANRRGVGGQAATPHKEHWTHDRSPSRRRSARGSRPRGFPRNRRRDTQPSAPVAESPMARTFELEQPVGRDEELALADGLLRATLADAGDADPHVRALLVGGDAGIGKTTLVHALGARAAALGLGFTVGHCLDLATGPPFGPVTEALRAIVNHHRQPAGGGSCAGPVARRRRAVGRGRLAREPAAGRRGARPGRAVRPRARGPALGRHHGPRLHPGPAAHLPRPAAARRDASHRRADPAASRPAAAPRADPEPEHDPSRPRRTRRGRRRPARSAAHRSHPATRGREPAAGALGGQPAPRGGAAGGR